MRTGIHPEYVEATVTCSCGNTFKTRSTVADLHIELCNECHPFYTGKQKLVDSGGRVERFQKRYGRKSFTSGEGKPAAPAKPAAAAEPAVEAPAETDTTEEAAAAPAAE